MTNVKPLRSDSDEINLKHRQLLDDVATAEGAYRFWNETVEAEPFKEFKAALEQDIQQDRVALEDAKSEDIKTLQANIRSRKRLLDLVADKADVRHVTNKKRLLHEFEDKNALLLQERSAE